MFWTVLMWLAVGAKTVAPGDPLVDPSRLVPYEARWRNVAIAEDGAETETETAVVTERLERATFEGRPALRQIQVMAMAGGGGTTTTTLFFDPETLVLWRQEVETPSGQLVRTDYDWSKLEAIRSVDGGEASPPAPIERGFVATRPGLVIGSLPLAEGFSARIPFGFSGQRFWVTASVTGSTRFDPGDGVARDAWIVETEWEQVRDPDVVFMGDFTVGNGGGTWLFFKSPEPGAYALARVRYQLPGPDNLIEMRDGPQGAR